MNKHINYYLSYNYIQDTTNFSCNFPKNLLLAEPGALDYVYLEQLKVINNAQGYLNLMKKKYERRFVNVLFFAVYYFQLSLKFNAILYKPELAVNVLNFPYNHHLYRKNLCNQTPYFLQKQLFKQYRQLQLCIYLYKEMRVIYSKISIYCGLFSSFFKKIGNPRRKLKRKFPSVNVAFRFTISKYVIF